MTPDTPPRHTWSSSNSYSRDTSVTHKNAASYPVRPLVEPTTVDRKRRNIVVSVDVPPVGNNRRPRGRGNTADDIRARRCRATRWDAKNTVSAIGSSRNRGNTARTRKRTRPHSTVRTSETRSDRTVSTSRASSS